MSERPFLADEREELARIAAELLAERKAAYPSLVKAEKMTQAEADAGERIMVAIVADWRRIVALYTGQLAGERDQTASAPEKVATLEQAARRLAARKLQAGTALNAAMPQRWRDLIRDGMISREELQRAHDEGEIRAPEVPIFLLQERRLWAVEAMLWHARRGSRAMLIAEISAELRERDQVKAAA